MKNKVENKQDSEQLNILAVNGSLRSNAIEFAKWLQYLDNGTTHYNPFTKEETESIGFSPYDCLIDEVYTIEELYDKWKLLSNDR
jgi:hypothetical protein